MPNRRSLGILVASLILVLAPVSVPAFAPQSAARAQSARQAQKAEVDPEVESLEARADDQEHFVDRLFLLLSILVGLLAAGGLAGLVASIRFERRQTQLHQLAVAGETASQERAAESYVTFLKGSQETLMLVNDTLRLAKEASERAEKAIEEKASERLNEIDRDAKQILSSALDRNDFKAVVRDSWMEQQLEDVAERLRGIEDFAEAHGLELSPYCLFAKGLDRHLSGAPERAIDNWCRAAARAQSQELASGEDHELAALARFWVGYERNNIGLFQKAAKAFRIAREKHLTDKGQAQHFELARIEIQSRFFAAAREHFKTTAGRRELIGEFLAGLENLLRDLDPKRKDFLEERWLCEQTVGELLIWSARLSPLERTAGEPLSEEERAALGEAVAHFERAGDLVWARFGHAQARWALGEELGEEQYDSLLHTLMTEAWSHREPRALALRHAGILIAEGEHHDGEEKLDAACKDLWNDLGHIRGQLTVFSPWQKANVSFEHFEEEVRAYQRAPR